jgi:hypothetical protein
MVRNATGTLASYDGRVLIITMKHVLDLYRSELANDARTIFRFSETEFDPLTRIAGEHASSDLVSISAENLDIHRAAPHLPPLVPYPISRVPLPKPVVGDQITLTGWPEEVRQLNDGGREIHHKPESLIGIKVTHLFEDRFQCILDRTDWEDSAGRTEYLGAPIGSGFSGAPMFSQRLESGVAVLTLVGFVREYGGVFDVLVGSYSSDTPGLS